MNPVTSHNGGVSEAQHLFMQGRLPAARALSLQILAATPENVDALQLLGVIAQQARELETALTYLTRADQQSPNRADLLANLGNVLRALERHEDALIHLERAAQLAPEQALIQINLGLVYQDLKQYTRAEAAFRQAVAVQPELAAAHQSLGHLLMLSDLSQARAHLIRALKLSPGFHAAFKDLVAVLISLGEPAPALALCMRRLRTVPSDQDALAMLGIALRELGRASEADQLVNFDIFLKSYTLTAPPGFSSIADFNAALEAHVRAHPKLTPILFGNATHNGKRINDLMVEPMGPMRLLASMVTQQIHAYWNALPRIAGHPFFAQAKIVSGQLRSWAVLMDCHGYETPHIHPDGLVSGVYYVSLPDVVERSASHAGWIEFGEPDPVFATRQKVPRKLVKPVAGSMLLFPSYFWHKTIPFDSDQQRLSIAFDLSALAPSAS